MIAFGEIIWDCLPTGKVLGGAQLNMSVQMHNIGLNPILITAVGQDELGDEMMADVTSLGLDTSSIAQIEKYPTSRVDIKIDSQGKPTYDIKMPVAWDAIPINERHLKIASKEGIIFGTMAQRMDDETYHNLDILLKHSKLNFFDANFRLPFTTKELLLKYLPITDIFKINDEELPILLDWMGLDLDIEDGLQFLAEKYNIQLVVHTQGSNGSLILSESKFYRHPGFNVKVDDTVGCGDAFTAGIVYALEHNMDVKSMIEFASALSAAVATKKGGCCHVTLDEVKTLIA